MPNVGSKSGAAMAIDVEEGFSESSSSSSSSSGSRILRVLVFPSALITEAMGVVVGIVGELVMGVRAGAM